MLSAMKRIEEELEQIRQQGLWRQLTPHSRMGACHESGPISFASNDYLGLSQHPAITSAFYEGLEQYGHGSASSRLICGTSVAHTELENRLAALKGTDRALTFSSGFATAMGTIPALLGKDDFVVLDKLSHACLIDAAKLSTATLRVFPHNHLAKLESILQQIRSRHGSAPRILIVTESVFSMDGDLAPLREIVELKQRYDAWLLVDEAHGFGVLGPHGAGLAEELALQGRIDLQMGTLSKAAGLAGGFIAASSPVIDLLINRARSFIFSTAPPPALAHAAVCALEIIASPEGQFLRQQLQERIHDFTIGLLPDPHRSPIVPLILGSNEAALRASQQLTQKGFVVPAIRYPTVPRNLARLRVSLSAVHTPHAVMALREACRIIDQINQADHPH
jgi:8-amino-7-oxononanoate synthase